MSISAIEKNVKTSAHISFSYLIFSLICIVFGAIYEKFSHEVYSYAMIYAFMFPLCGGVFLFSFLSLKRPKAFPRASSLRLYHFGITTLTTGSIVNGILEIYGTDHRLLTVYWGAGAALTALGLLKSALDLYRISNQPASVARKSKH